ncbi:hypothetical protein [Streptomyces prasinopilosus]|uniref:hypothetical protein n=1 Tax=Streptomyces prasinopilosus TaxID=67344 RepID=UPI0006EB2BF8|nr:hypothetical protein [Streptomyces prasinopilosus]
MAIKLDRNHRLETGQTFGRMPDNPSDTLTTPDKTWVAAVIDNTTGRFVVKSALSATQAEAIADAEAQYRRR